MNEDILPFQEVLDVLLDDSKEIPQRYFAEFSDIDPVSLTALLETWSSRSSFRSSSMRGQVSSKDVSEAGSISEKELK